MKTWKTAIYVLSLTNEAAMLSCDTSRFHEVLHPFATQQNVTLCLRDREPHLSNVRLCFPFTFL